MQNEFYSRYDKPVIKEIHWVLLTNSVTKQLQKFPTVSLTTKRRKFQR